MRILQIHNQHATEGGADHVLHHEAELLSDAGHEVDRFLLPPADSMGGAGLSNGVKAIWNVEACREIGRTIDRFDPDVVHVHTPFPLLSPAVFRTIAKHGKPSVGTAHSFRYSCIKGTCLRDGHTCEDCVGTTLKLPGIKNRCYHNSLAGSAALTLGLSTHRALGTFEQIGRLITLTEFARQLLIRDGMAPERIVVKPNSIPDPGASESRQGPPSYAAFLGRFVEEKGIRTLLEAWETIGERLPLRIAGDGPMRPLVEEAAASTPGIEYVGWLDDADLNSFVSDAELLVMPSEWYEAGEPLVLIRAMAMTRPAVTCDLENICATVRETESGLIFRTGDAASLAETVLKGLENVDDLRKMGVRGRAVYERTFTPDRNRERLEQIYQSVIAEKQPAASR